MVSKRDGMNSKRDGKFLKRVEMVFKKCLN
jgi:hypothetical protein